LPAPSSIEEMSIEAIDAFLDRITLHVDADVRVIDKPYGLAVQKGTRTAEDLDSLLTTRARACGERLRLVHRLDKETSGCLVLAATQEAARLLGREISSRRAVKTYWALVHGVPEPRAGSIRLPLIKAPGPEGDRVRPAVTGELASAWSAVTHYEVLQARMGSHAFVALTPETGRQHQVRAHLAAIGHPIFGDSKYPPADGTLAAVPPGQASMLHLLARAIAIRHPKGQMLTIQAPLPPHMRATFARLGFAADPAAIGKI
jgi:23S rRNA pseudouridine955/2504/2580 synthase